MTAPRAIEVLDPGLLTTVQDAAGRRGWRRYGVPACGALDPYAARLANLLAGNDDDAGLLEVTLAGPALRFTAPTVVALAGADLGATIDRRALAPGQSLPAPAGSTLRFGERRAGARAYLAFGGGIVVEPILGSRATDLRSGFGGLDGRALRAGDRLALGAPGYSGAHRRGRPPVTRDTIRVLPGPHLELFAADELGRLCAAGWTVSSQADRMGYRLDGPALARVDTSEVPSVGLPLGAVQVPPDGRPIVTLADRPVTGGYPVIAVVARADIGLVAQALPGEPVRFDVTTPAAARAALAEQERRLSEITVDEEDAAWAGALD